MDVMSLLLVLLLSSLTTGRGVDVTGLLEELMSSVAKSGYGQPGYEDYVEPYGYGDMQQHYGKSGYDAIPVYTQATVYVPAPMYAPAPTYAPPATYAPTYAPPPTYAPSYAPPPSYAPEPSYTPVLTYAPAPIYLPEPSYEPAPSYEPVPRYEPVPSYEPAPSYPLAPSYEMPHSYPPPSYPPARSYLPEPSYPQPPPYDYKPKPHYKVKIKKVYIPVAVRRKKKKMKIISVQKGFFIPGGTQLFGKYKTLKACEKACAATPNCFAGDYNPWFKKCYIHSNYTACGTMSAHKKLIHFKKVPCSFPEAPEGRVMLGVQIFKGIEQKGIKSLSDCLKKCAAAGDGIQAVAEHLTKQICFGIDYDFGTHKCYFHVNNMYPPQHFCPYDGSPPLVPRDTVPNPSVVSILLCPGP